MNERGDQPAASEPAARGPATEDYRPITEGPGAAIGHYKLLQMIGEGGFGVVYMAEQQHPVRRKVALKIIKPGMDTREVIARFESERQALALMDHPNIARVLDAGATTSGRPYFVMELVKGVPITEYCDKNHSPAEARLELFITVCHAVQHAHQKGVIHRDLKPSNVMVTLHDGKPVPKVIDFGVAKATSQQLTEKTLFTAYGQMIGTPAYMSPEQAEMSGLDIDTRSDIYSLGVLLYELLTGSTPFDGRRLRDASYIELQRIIREEEPQRPSTRISTLGEKATVISSERNTEPKRLRQMLQGDLDVIVMKALDKERSRRYETPNSFAQDLERFLRHEAILARPPSTVYRLRKFTQRNKAAVAAGSAVVASLLLGMIISTLSAIHATDQRNQARGSLAEAQRQQKIAEDAKQDAELQRDAAERAKLAEAELRQLADNQRQQAELAQQTEAELRALAELKRKDIERQNAEIAGLNTRLRGVMDDQRRTLYTTQLNLLPKAWEADNVGRMLELLNAQRPRAGETDLRGFEWQYWHRLCHSELQTVKLSNTRFEAGSMSVSMGGRAVEFSPDGKRIAATLTGSVKLWDTTTGREVWSIMLPSGARTMYATPGMIWDRWLVFLDNQRLGVVRPELNGAVPESCEMTVYDLESRQTAYTLREKTVGYVASSDHTRVVAVIRDGAKDDQGQAVSTAKIWDAKTGEQVATVRLAGDAWTTLALSPGGTRLAASSGGMKNSLLKIRMDNPSIRIWDVASGEEKATIRPVGTGEIAFSPDGTRLAAVTMPMQSRPSAGSAFLVAEWAMYDTETGKKLWSVPVEHPISGLWAKPVFSPDGAWVAFVRNALTPYGRSLTPLAASDGKVGPALKGHAQPLVAATFSADGKKLFTADGNAVVKSWDAPVAAVVPRPSAPAAATLYSVSPDGRRRASAPFVSLSAPLLPGVATKPQYRIVVKDTATGTELWSHVVPGNLEHLAHSPDGAFVAGSYATGAGDKQIGHVGVWEAETGKPMLTIQRPMMPRLSPPSHVSRLMYYKTQRIAPDFAFSPDSRQIAVAGPLEGGEAHVWTLQHWDLTTVTAKTAGPMMRGATGGLQFSPNGKRLLVQTTKTQLIGSKSGDAKGGKAESEVGTAGIQVWDATTGQMVWGQSIAPTGIEFSNDGSLLCGYWSRAVTVWDAATGEERIRIPAEETLMSKLAFSPRGELVAMTVNPSFNPASPGLGYVRVWDVETGSERFRLPGHSAGVSDVVFSEDGTRIATTAGTSGETKLWDADTGQELLTLAGVHGGLNFGSDGRHLTGMITPSFLEGSYDEPRRIVIADASSLDPNVEAREMVEWLTTRREGQPLATRGERLAAIEADRGLSDAARARSLELIRTDARNAGALNAEAWKVVKLKDQPREEYQRAMEYASEACEVAPKNQLVWNTRGVAQFRLEQFEQARADFERSIDVRKAANQPTAPEDLVFLAMSHHRLGNKTEAEKFLSRFRELINLSGSTKVSEWRGHLADAESLFGVRRTPAAPQFIPGWGEAIDPLGDCQIAGSNSSLMIVVPGTLHSLAPANLNFDAPRVLQDVEGDFTVQVKVTCPIEPQAPLTDRGIAFFGAGLLVWENADNLLRVERDGYFLHPNRPVGSGPAPPPQQARKFSSHLPLVEYIRGGRDNSEGRNVWNAAAPLLPGPATWLRLIRRGATIQIAFSHDGQAWQEVAPVAANFSAKVRVGVVVRNNSGSEFSAEFSELGISQP